LSVANSDSGFLSDEEILTCVERGLDKVGTGVKKLVFWHLQKLGHIKRNEIPRKPELFVSGLRLLYRESAASVEKAIVQELNSEFGFSFAYDQLADAIVQAKKKTIVA